METQAEMCSYFNKSPKRQSKLSQIIDETELTDEKRRKLKSLSQTRWVDR